MADAKKRILLYQEKTTVDNTDYMLIDSSANGTNKYQVTRILTEAEAAAQAKVDAEAAAREAADNELKADFTQLFIDGSTRFQSNLFSSGEVQANRTFVTKSWRVSANTDIVIPYDMTITPLKGFRVYVYNASTTPMTAVGWKTATFKLTKNQSVRFIIARVSENTSETASVSDFVGKLQINTEITYHTTKIDNYLNSKAYNTPKLIGYSAWNIYKKGFYGISDGLFTEQDNYICTSDAISVNAGDLIAIKDFPANSVWLYIIYYKNGAFLSQYNSSISTTPFYFVVPSDATEVNINISFSSGTNLDSIVLPSVLINPAESVLVRLNALETNDGFEELPNYWKSHLNSKIEGIQDFSDRSAIGDSFIFFTDYHMKNNAKNTPNLIRSLIADTDIKFAVHGGDVITQESTQAEAFAVLAEYNKSFNGIPLFNVIGNHDQNNPGTPDQTWQITNAQAYSMLCKKCELEFVDTNGFDYCVDNKAQKIRYFFIGAQHQSWIVTSQVRWICSQFLDVPNGYSIFVFSHIGATSDGVNGNFQPILDAMSALYNKESYHYSVNDYDYSNKNVTVIGVMSGHVHYDCYYVTDEGFPVIGVTTDAIGETHPQTTMTSGTDTEQAFEVVRIDMTNRKIYCARIGAGSNRTFDY